MRPPSPVHWLLVATCLIACSSDPDASGAAGQPAAGTGGTGGSGGLAGAGGAAGKGQGGAGQGGAGQGGAGQGGAGGEACEVSDQEACSVWQQCGCPAGYKCDTMTEDGESHSECIPDAGDGEGAKGCPDGHSESCAVGRSCTHYSDGATGDATACEAWCRLDEASDCPGGVCRAYDDPIVIEGVSYGTCRPRCDPLDPEPGCGPGATCMLRGSGDAAFTVCLTAGEGAGVGGCEEGFYECAPGRVCNSSAGSCQRYCRTGQPGDCAAGQECVGFSTPRRLDGVEYGLCREQCDPMNPDAACPAGSNCRAFQDADKAYHTQCIAAGTARGPAACDEALVCAPGYTCTYYTSGDAQGTTCNRLCTEAQMDVCGDEAICVLYSNVVLDGVKQGACRRRCDLSAPAAACGTQGTCLWFKGADGVAVTDCFDGYGKGDGEGECADDPYACAPGHVCLDGACRRWCKTGQSDDMNGCPAGSLCTGWSPALVIGEVTYGRCLPGPT